MQEYTLVLNAAEGRIQCLMAEVTEEEPSGIICRSFQEWHAPGQGAELLTPVLANMFARLRMRPSDIRRIAVVNGPGGFTGIRLGLSTAAGLARATKAQQAGLAYLPLLARTVAGSLQIAVSGGAAFEKEILRIWVVTHARRNLVHAQAFEMIFAPLSAAPDDAPPVRALTDILVADLDGLVAGIASLGGQCILAGSGAVRNGAALLAAAEKQGVCLCLGPASLAHPSAEVLLAAAQEAGYSVGDIQPLYVRESDAEENLPHIARSLQLDPERARRELDTLRSQHIILRS